MKFHRFSFYAFVCCISFLGILTVSGEQTDPVTSALIDGQGQGWKSLGECDFVNVNCFEDTWTWDSEGAHCTGQPVGVIRTKKKYKNFELVAEWRHNKYAGNSGIFVWMIDESLKDLKPGGLPHGIEVQVLDLGYEERYEKENGKKSDWFTSHGDVFPVGAAEMKPFPPVAPNGRRSFPTESRSLAAGNWNHYYVRCINGEVRLWVNGVEVSGGTGCSPSEGYLGLESEGSPIDFRNLRIRELP